MLCFNCLKKTKNKNTFDTGWGKIYTILVEMYK